MADSAWTNGDKIDEDRPSFIPEPPHLSNTERRDPDGYDSAFIETNFKAMVLVLRDAMHEVPFIQLHPSFLIQHLTLLDHHALRSS